MPVPLENAVALGRIGGPLLAENLVRKNTGVGEQNLAFHNVSDTDNILFLNVIDGKVGINNGNPQEALDVTGIIHSDDYLATTSASIAKFSVSTNRIINPFAGVNGKIIISPNQTLDPTILGPRFETVDLGIDDALIENLTLDSHINLNTVGTGQVYFTTSELLINGNLTVTGTTTWDGSLVTLGSSSDDNVIFNADINSHIIPNANDTWDLGSALQRWNTVYVKDLFADILYVSSSYIVSGIDVFLRQGNTIYVSVNGLDTNVGDHTHGTYRTIKHALSQATNGDTVVIFPGTYEEIFPLTVPQGVTVNGAGIRAVTVKPTAGTKTNNAFLLNGETTVSNLTVKDFYAPGNAFSFAANFTVSSRSPYIQNVSVITAELPAETAPGITVGPSPTGISLTSNSVTLSKTFYSQTLVDSLVGQIAVIDRYPAAPLFYTVVSIETEPLSPTEWRMTVDSTFNAAGQLKPISFYPDVELTQIITTDIWATTGNSVGEKWVAYYKTGLPEFFTTLVQPGWSINVAGTVYIVDYIIEDPVNTNMWRIYVTTSLVAGVGIPIFSSPVEIVEPLSAGKGALVDGSLANSASKEASMLFNSVTFIVPNVDGITATNGARVEWLNSFTYFAERGIYLTQGTAGFANLGVKFGAELRSIGSANVYGTYGAVADGANTLAYLIGHNFAYIGTGTNSANDPSIVIQANEVLEVNNGRIYYESADHKGDVRIGDIFYVNQETGVISFNAQALSFSPSGSISVEGGTSPSYIDKNMVISGNIKIYDNNIDSLSGPVNFLASSGSTYLNTNVLVTGNTTVSSDINLDGNLYLGNQSTDSITVFSNLTQDLLPDDVGGPFTLGTDSNRWNTLYATLLNVDNVTQISSNTISTLTTNTNLILSAAGTGQVQVTNTDVTIANDLTVGNALTVNGATSLKNTEIGEIVPFGALLHTLNNPNAPGVAPPSGQFPTLVDNFGRSVAVSGNYAIVSAPYSQFWQTPPNTVPVKVYIYNVTTGAIVHELSNPSGSILGIGDDFGNSVAISGNYAIVGASSAKNVGPYYPATSGLGKAYIYNVTTGALLHTLNNPGADLSSYEDYFGQSVAISGNYAIVGAHYESNVYIESGKAYIYNITTGALVHTLNNPNPYGTQYADYFGYSVAISGNYAIVGAYQEDEAGGAGGSSGKAYIFNVTTGARLFTLNNPNAYSTGLDDKFGNSVAISGNYAIVGAYQEDDASGTNSGKAYIYNVTTGALVHTLNNPNAYSTSASDLFGYSVAISGNYAIVGTPQEDDAGGTDSGKAYIYNVTTGALVHTINNPTAYSTSNGDFFGNSVAISGNYVIVGAVGEDDLGGTGSGKAYIFTGQPTNPKDLTLVGNLNQTGDTNITGLFANTNIEITGSSYFAVPDIKLQNSEISATATNSDLTFTGATTGNVVLDQRLKINGSTISNVWSSPTTDTQRSVIFQPNGTGSVTITSTSAVKIPVGNTTTRTIAAGEIRYNDATNLYEGGAGSGLISFNGLYDSDRNTYITAGAIDNTIYFGINNVVKTTLNSTSLNSDIFEAGNVRLTGNTLSNIVSGNDLTFAPDGNGNTVLNGLPISQNYIVNSLNTSLNLNTTGLGYVKFSGTNGLVVPAGNDSGRRGTPELGELRYNTQAAGVLEIYDGTQWMSAVGNNATVSEADVLDVLELWTLILG